jgi:hypothetical protein
VSTRWTSSPTNSRARSSRLHQRTGHRHHRRAAVEAQQLLGGHRPERVPAVSGGRGVLDRPVGAKRAVTWKSADDGAEGLAESGCLSDRTPASHDRRGRARVQLERDPNVTDTGRPYQSFSPSPAPCCGRPRRDARSDRTESVAVLPRSQVDAQHVATRRTLERRGDQWSGTAPGRRVQDKVGR